MRILHTNAAYWPFVGGAETYLQAMSERLARDGHAVTVATTDATAVQFFWDPHLPCEPEREATKEGVRIVRSQVRHLPCAPWSHYLLRRVATDLSRLPFTGPILDRLAPAMPWVPTLERTLEGLTEGFDLVHGVNIALEWPLLAGWRYARHRGLPFVATPFVHVGEWAVQRFYTMPHQLAALRDADRVLVQTDIEAQELARLGVATGKIVRLGMGVDLERLRGGDGARFRAQHGIEGPIVTFMGAVTDDKGAIHLMRAMQRLWDGSSGEAADPHLAPPTLVVAGPSVSPSTFDRAFEGLPDSHRQHIRRLGPVQGQLKQDMLAATDLFAMPSRVDSFGIVYLEAWAYGVPVIGCRAGGVPDVIDQGQDGLLVPFGDPTSLASAIQALLGEPERRREMGRRGRAKVEVRYTWDRIYEDLLKVYADLVPSCIEPNAGVGREPPCG